MSEVALITSVNGDGLATVVDILTGMNVASLKNSSALPGGTALISGDFVVSAQVCCSYCMSIRCITPPM